MVTVFVAVFVGVFVTVLVGLFVGVLVEVLVGVEVAVFVGVQTISLVISIAVNSALSTEAVPMISISPVVTFTKKLWSSAVNSPTSEKISRFGNTVVPLMATLKTRSPGPVQNNSEFFKVTI